MVSWFPLTGEPTLTHGCSDPSTTEFRQQTPRHDGVTGRGSQHFRRCVAAFAPSPPWHCGFPPVSPPETWCTLGFNIQPVPSTNGTDKDLAARNGCPPLLRTEQGSREHVSPHITESLYVCIYKSIDNMYYLTNSTTIGEHKGDKTCPPYFTSSTLPLCLFYWNYFIFLQTFLNSFLAFSPIVCASASFLYSHHPPRGLCPSILPFLLSLPSHCFSFTSSFCAVMSVLCLSLWPHVKTGQCPRVAVPQSVRWRETSFQTNSMHPHHSMVYSKRASQFHINIYYFLKINILRMLKFKYSTF